MSVYVNCYEYELCFQCKSFDFGFLYLTTLTLPEPHGYFDPSVYSAGERKRESGTVPTYSTPLLLFLQLKQENHCSLNSR